MNAASFLALPAAYGLGGISAGYWLVRLRTGTDVRLHGSGATGATNAARLLGRGGFVMVLALDAAKGALAVALARGLGLTDGWEFAGAAAVVAGHVWPVQLRFRGGRGLGPLLGAWLVLAPLAIGACLVIAGVAWAASRRRVASGLFGAALLPLTTWWTQRNGPSAALTTLTFAIVAFAHRSHWTSSASPPGTT
jgi:glycerol-3-phosphate acyltransferase PlsY